MRKWLLLIPVTVVLMLQQVAAQAPVFSAGWDARKQGVSIRFSPDRPGTHSVTIQRSPDSRSWSDIALQQIPGMGSASEFNYTDRNAGPGENYYRLRFSNDSDRVDYSKPVMLIITPVEKNWTMYPVPVRDVLNLQYRGLEPIRGVVQVFIQSESGHILTRLRSASINSLIQIPVSNLGRGIYDIRILIENEIVWNQRFIK